MKTIISKELYRVTIIIALFAFGCSEEDEVVNELNEVVEERVDTDTASNEQKTLAMYFPSSGNQSWETIAPAELAWDTARLNDAIRYARDNNTYSLMILHKGRIVVEEYWKERNNMSRTGLASVSKSMMAFAIGILQQEGAVGIDDYVSSILDSGWSNSPNSEREITIRHLLTMTSGLNDDLKYVGPPGKTWRYSHGAYSMLFDIIKAISGSDSRKFFEKNVFTPIGMDNYAWEGEELSASARDLARFGLLVLNKGSWNGKKIIHDDGYFKDMLATSQDMQQAYGYLWWLNGKSSYYDDDVLEKYDGPIASTMPSDAILAKGKHDQRIEVIPSLDLIVIRQGGSTMLPELGNESFDYHFWHFLRPAIVKSDR